MPISKIYPATRWHAARYAGLPSGWSPGHGQFHGLRGQSGSGDPALGGAQRGGRDSLIPARNTPLQPPIPALLHPGLDLFLGGLGPASDFASGCFIHIFLWPEKGGYGRM